jgi:hypothetical protein
VGVTRNATRRFILIALAVLPVVLAAPSTASAAVHTTNGWEHGIKNGCCWNSAWAPVYEDNCRGASPPWRYGYCTPQATTQDIQHICCGFGKYAWAGVYHRHDNGSTTQQCFYYNSLGTGNAVCDGQNGWGSLPCRKEAWTAGEHRGAGITDHVNTWHGVIAASC